MNDDKALGMLQERFVRDCKCLHCLDNIKLYDYVNARLKQLPIEATADVLADLLWQQGMPTGQVSGWYVVRKQGTSSPQMLLWRGRASPSWQRVIAYQGPIPL